jgi:hypothetical protein
LRHHIPTIRQLQYETSQKKQFAVRIAAKKTPPIPGIKRKTTGPMKMQITLHQNKKKWRAIDMIFPPLHGYNSPSGLVVRNGNMMVGR